MVLLLSGLLCAFSSTESTKLTPQNIADQPHLLCVGTEKHGEEMQFTVLVRFKEGKRKPLVEGGYLHVNDGKAFVARSGVPAEDHPEAQRNIVTFRFAVSPKYLETSTFGFSVATLNEQALKDAPPGVGWRAMSSPSGTFRFPARPSLGSIRARTSRHAEENAASEAGSWLFVL